MAKKSTWRPVYREITSSARQLVNAGLAWRETVKRVAPTEWVATPERMAEAQKLLAEVKGWQTRAMARRPDATRSSKPGDKVKLPGFTDTENAFLTAAHQLIHAKPEAVQEATATLLMAAASMVGSTGKGGLKGPG